MFVCVCVWLQYCTYGEYSVNIYGVAYSYLFVCLCPFECVVEWLLFTFSSECIVQYMFENITSWIGVWKLEQQSDYK